METEDKKKEAYRVGVAVLIILIVSTIGEFFIGTVASLWWAVLMSIAILKAFFIIRDYMHIGRLFAADEEEAHS
jgi:hypothetical protein